MHFSEIAATEYFHFILRESINEVLHEGPHSTEHVADLYCVEAIHTGIEISHQACNHRLDAIAWNLTGPHIVEIEDDDPVFAVARHQSKPLYVGE